MSILNLLTLTLALALFALSFKASAVTDTTIRDRFAVVGVISEDSQSSTNGIAVIRDMSTGNNIIVKAGDYLTSEFEWRLKSVARNRVIIENGESEYNLEHYETPKPKFETILSQDREETGETEDRPDTISQTSIRSSFFKDCRNF